MTLPVVAVDLRSVEAALWAGFRSVRHVLLGVRIEKLDFRLNF